MYNFFKKIIFSLLILITLKGCKQEYVEKNLTSLTDNPSLNSPTTIRIMGHWLGEGQKEYLVREGVREFLFLNQDLIADLKFSQEIFTVDNVANLYHVECDSIAQMIRLNKWPFDVLFCDQERYKRVGQLVGDIEWGKKYLVDFSNEEWFIQAHKPGIFETAEIKNIYGGIIPGPLIEGITNILYKSEYVEKHIGLNVKDIDMNEEDFINYAKAVYEYNQKHSEKITFFSRQYQYALVNLFSQLVTSYYQKAEFSSIQESLQALLATYKIFETLTQYDAFTQYVDYTKKTYDVAQRTLYDKNILFHLQPSWILLFWEKSNLLGARQMHPCEIPSFKERKSNFYSGFFQVIFVVPKNAPNPEAGIRFIKHITSTETADKWVKYSSCPTGMKNTISYTDFGQNKYERFFQHLQKKYGNNQVEVNLSKLLFNSEKNINFHYLDIINKQLTAEEALNLVKQQLTR